MNAMQLDLFPLSKGHVYTTEWYDVELCRKASDYVFVFGDNLQRFGKRGQAIIRDEPNTFGLITKRAPTVRSESYFYDDSYKDRDVVEKSLERLYLLSLTKKLVFPAMGLGTGLSKMDVYCPKLLFKIDEVVSNLLCLDYRELRNGQD